MANYAQRSASKGRAQVATVGSPGSPGSIFLSASESGYDERTTELLKAACNVLVEQGYLKFTLRTIATAAGVHLKTLQRAFPNKRTLLRDTIRFALDTCYVQKYRERLAASDPRPAQERLLDLVDFLIADVHDPWSTRFFSELWALAARETDAADAMDALYTAHRVNIAGLVRAMNPNISDATVEHRAVIVAMMLQGMVLMLGDGKPRHAEFENLDVEIKQRILDIVISP